MLSYDKISKGPKQGDQIGRIIAHWAIVYFGQVFENYTSGPNFLATTFDSRI
jgi:hypothetical protein